MPATEILQQAKDLHTASDSLSTLADEHPLVAEALLAISGNLRSSAVILEVLVLTKLGPAAK